MRLISQILVRDEKSCWQFYQPEMFWKKAAHLKQKKKKNYFHSDGDKYFGNAATFSIILNLNFATTDRFKSQAMLENAALPKVQRCQTF